MHKNGWIDISQIRVGEATEQHPITLHYGHHYLTAAKKSIVSSQLKESVITQMHSQQHGKLGESNKLIVVERKKGTEDKKIIASQQPSNTLKILSLQQIKKAHRKYSKPKQSTTRQLHRRSLNKKQTSPQQQQSPLKNKHNKKLSLLKNLQCL